MRRALVTGGSTGIGRACVLVLARRGHRVAFTYRTRSREADEVAAEARRISGELALVLRADLADPAAAGNVVREAAGALDGLDVLVNNAGVSPTARVEDATVAQWQETLAVNLIAPFAGCRAALELMRPGAGIVNVTSVLAGAPLEGKGAYCAAKAGLEMLTRVLALEAADRGIRVNAVAPGHIVTPMNFPDGLPPDGRKGLPSVPAGRAGRAAEVASVVAFLASDEASYVTGTSVLVDGGMVLVGGAQVLERTALSARLFSEAIA